MMSSRIRQGEKHLFDCFLEVVKPSGSSLGAGGKSSSSSSAGSSSVSPWILQSFPTSYKQKEADRLRSVPDFVFPCELEINTVQNFSFVLTNVDAQWTFGFCRQVPNSQTALVILSSLPWHETFYRVLNHAAELALSTDDRELIHFLEECYNTRVPDPGSPLHVSWLANGAGSVRKDFSSPTPPDGRLPTIPENRNLTEYYNAVGIHNMLVIFASMLYERRIIITSRRLSRLSACVQAANAIIYPMHWQHIFIPILPKHLMEYLSAPMPFLIGVPSPIMQRVKSHELGEAVILDADSNVIQSPFADLESLPFEVASNLKRSLKNHKDLLGDSVARAFLQALVHLIGGYRDALKFRQGEEITFHDEAFLMSRPVSLRPFLEQMLQLQIFRQFIEERLQMLNTGKGFTDEFEMEAVRFQERINNNSKFKNQYAQISSSVKKEGGAIVKAVKSKANPAVKSAVKSVRESSRGLQYKGKSAYKEIRSKMKTTNSSSQLEEYESNHHSRSVRLGSNASSSSAPSSPVLANRRAMSVSSASSLGSTASVSNGHQQVAPKSAKTMTMPVSGLARNDAEFNIGSHVLKYECFDPPVMPGVPHNPFHHSASDSKLSPEIEAPQRINFDLLSDLQEVMNKNKQTEKLPLPPINRHLKPSLRRTLASNITDAHSSTLSTSCSQPNLIRALPAASSYENLYSSSNDLEVEVASDGEEEDDPFRTDHIPFPPDESPVIRVAKQKLVSEMQAGSAPVVPPRTNKARKATNTSSSSSSFPCKASGSSGIQQIESTPNHARKESVGDLITLHTTNCSLQDDVIFDPLLEPQHSQSSALASKFLLLPNPPIASKLPQFSTATPEHKPLQRAGNIKNPFGSPTATTASSIIGTKGNGSVDNKSRQLLTKSSDDLLKDYGIDFGKLTTASGSSNGLLLMPQQNSLSMIGMDEKEDPFAELDPIRKVKVGKVQGLVMQAEREAAAAAASQLPMAPPRARKQQQNWTTFE